MEIDIRVRVKVLEKHREESGSGRLLRATSAFGASSGLVTSSWVTAAVAVKCRAATKEEATDPEPRCEAALQRRQRRPTHLLEVPSSSGTTSGWRFWIWARSDEVLPRQALSVVGQYLQVAFLEVA
jgi:hypothetical protein